MRTTLAVALVMVAGMALAEDKLPVPDAPAKAEALKLLRDIFKDDLASARVPDAKRALATKLSAQAAQEKSPANKLALLDEAARLSAEAGDAKGVVAAMADESKAFAIPDEVTLLKGMLDRCRPTAKDDVMALSEAWLGLADKAVMGDNLDAAASACSAAESAARQAQQLPLVSQAQARGKEVGSARLSWDAAKKAYPVLKDKPDDGAACSAVGRWLVLWKDNAEGLPLLSKGSDAALAGAAKKELALPREAKPEDMAAVGDGWWEWGTKTGNCVGERGKGRARAWYQKAIEGGLSGMAKAGVEKRMAGEVASKTSIEQALVSSKYNWGMFWVIFKEGGVVIDSTNQEGKWSVKDRDHNIVTVNWSKTQFHQVVTFTDDYKSFVGTDLTRNKPFKGDFVCKVKSE